MVDKKTLHDLEREVRGTFSTSDVLLTSAIENQHIEQLEHSLIKLASASSSERAWALFVQDNILTSGNRTVTGIESGVCDPSREVRVYPSGMSCRMSPAPYHTFTCDRNVDITRGRVVTDVRLSVGRELHGHLVSFVESLPDTLIFKIGTDSAYVKNLTEETLVLRKEVVYSDVATLKRLGYGILIDNATRLTVGMFIIESSASEKNAGKRCYWFTGLHGTGKTTLAKAFVDTFTLKPILLDGDDVRDGVNRDLTLSLEDRDENIRRIAQMAKLLNAQGHDVCVCCISKERQQRAVAKDILGESYVEILVDSSDTTRRRRDTKGFYASGKEILDGYEPSEYPVITVSTDGVPVEQSLSELTNSVQNNGATS